jgi:polysaccharide deacetylase family sporulation protein PdaB
MAVLILFSKKRLLSIGLCLLLIVGATMGALLIFPGQLSHAVRYVIHWQRRLPVYSVQTEEKKIAISFDAAWGADRTDELLALLEEHQIRTTFFLVRFWVEKYPEVVQRIAAAGHEIGNHSATHPHMASLSPEQIQFELTSTHELIKEVSGQEPYLFRPPFGEYSNRVIENAEAVGYTTIQWSVDSLDWKPLSAAEIAQRVTSRIEPGAIVLFHNNGEHTPAALRKVLQFCHQEGYEVVPISELLLKGDYYIDVNGKMCPR